MLAGGDVMAILLAYGVVLLLSPPPVSLGSRLYLLGALPLWVLLNKLLGLYDRDANVIRKSTLDELPRIAHSVILGSAASFLLVPLIPGMEMFREQTLLFILALMLSMPAVRTGVRFGFNSRSEPERTLIVGSGSVAQLLASKLSKHPEYRVDLVGHVDQAWWDDEAPADAPPLLGHVEDFERICEELDVERVVIAFSPLSHEDLLARSADRQGAQPEGHVVPRLFEVDRLLRRVRRRRGHDAARRAPPRAHALLAVAQARLDLVGAGVRAAAPRAAARRRSPLAIKLTSRGPGALPPAPHRPRRPAVPDAQVPHDGTTAPTQRKAELRHLNEAQRAVFKIADDPRVTRVGRFLRRTVARRAAAAVERAAGRDEPRRPAPAGPRRGRRT